MRLKRASTLVLSLGVSLGLTLGVTAALQPAHADSNQAYLIGTLTDNAGRPLSGHGVHLAWCQTTDTSGGSVTPNANGCYNVSSGSGEVSGISATDYTDRKGRYVISVSKNTLLEVAQAAAANPGKWVAGGVGSYDAATGLWTYSYVDAAPAVGTNVTLPGIAVTPYSSPAPATGGVLTGVVTDEAGTPIPGVSVTASSTNNGDIQGATTGPDGRYYFQVSDPATYGGTNYAAYNVTGSVKLHARADGYVDEYAGETRAKTKAALVPVAAYGAPATSAPTITLGKQGTITGSVSLPAAGGNWHAYALILDLDGNYQAEAATDASGAFSADVDPGTYYVRGEGARFTEYADPDPGYCDTCVGTDDYSFVAGYYGKNAFSLATAKTVTVAADGNVAVGSIVLGNALKNLEKPVIKGKVRKNKKLSVTPGVWNQNADVAFTYTWKLGKKQIGSGASFKLTKKLWKKVGKKPGKLSVTITATDVYGEIVDGKVTLKVVKTLAKQAKTKAAGKKGKKK